MKDFNFFSKLKEQKGATGVDIVVSISVIAVTIAIVTAIYTNVDLASKRVQRTAGATRIATNIVEQIEKMYYEEFLDKVAEMKNKAAIASGEANPYITYDSTNEEFVVIPKRTSDAIKIFNTKIPKGYTVNISLEKDYEFDMVRKVNVEVKFPVGDSEESVKLSSAKSMEIVELGNEPEILDGNIIKTLNGTEYSNVMPIKKSGSKYIITSAEDEEWYNYEAAIWAKVLINSSGKYNTSTGNVNTGFESSLYVWIPSFGKDANGDLRFKYADTNYRVISKILDSGSLKKTIFTVDTVGQELTDFSTLVDFKDSSGNTVRGCWVKYSDIETNSYSILLNSSEYGPFDL